MNENFPNLELRPPLFYTWKTGIRFELGVDYDSDYAYENSPYLQGVYKRAITLFKSLHSHKDDIYIVVDVNDYSDGFKHKSNTFSRYIKEKPLLYRLNQTTTFHDDDEEGTYKTHRFTLKCRTSDFKYIPMLKAICNQDMGIRPSIFNRVYFININRKTIFHVYDDRGCDLLATSPETIRDVYDKYNDWILDYDRNEIDEGFK
ncbi:DUF3885 domain-containing protein [Peribacillus simplex]|nr:DUF3885 domain-containing protein [Peribacillus simplex]